MFAREPSTAVDRIQHLDDLISLDLFLHLSSERHSRWNTSGFSGSVLRKEVNHELPGRDGGDALQDTLLGEVEGAAVAEAGDEQLNFFCGLKLWPENLTLPDKTDLRPRKIFKMAEI
jgi:hypothetical protein